MDERTFFDRLSGKENILLYGAGIVGSLVLSRMEARGIAESCAGFMVTHAEPNQTYLGRKVFGLSEIAQRAESHPFMDAPQTCHSGHAIVVSAFKKNHAQLIHNLEQNGIRGYLVVDEDLYEEMERNYVDGFLSDRKCVPAQEKDVLVMSSDNNYSSGAFLCMVDLCVEMGKKGIRPLVVLPEYGNAEKLLEENGIAYTYVLSKKLVTVKGAKGRALHDDEGAVGRIKSLIEECRIKAVHNNSNHVYVGAKAAMEMGIPYIWHMRENIYEQGFVFADEKLAYRLINGAKDVIAVSRYVSSCYPGLNQKKARYIYDGVDSRKYYAERDILSDGRLRLLMPGGMSPLKGQHQLVKAAAGLKAAGLDFEASFVGSGDADYVHALEEMAKAHGLEDRIRFHDRVANLEEWYKEADVVVVCSRSEAFGRVTVEAMLAGCAVVGADCGATAELIEDGKTGYLYQLENIPMLVDKVLEIHREREKARQIARLGQKLALERYDRSVNFENIFQLYEDVL